ASTQMRCRSLQLRACRSWGARLFPAQTEMPDLSGEKILSRNKPRNPSVEESSFADAAAHRKSRLCCQAKQSSSRTLRRALARHVDLAAAQKKIASQRRNSHVDLSVHKSPHHS